MKKLVSLSLSVIFLAAIPAVSAPVPANGQSAGLVSSLINRLEKNKQSLKSLRAKISMEKYNAQIREKENYRGVVLYLPGAGRAAYVRIDWSSPQQETLAVSNGKYTLLRPRLKIALVGDMNKRPADVKGGSVLEFLTLSNDQVKQRFEPFQGVYEEKLWGGVNTTHIKLVPKGRADYLYAEVWIDSEGMPVQTKVVEKNEDSTTIRLLDVEKNVGIPLDLFKLKLDSDIKLIKG